MVTTAIPYAALETLFLDLGSTLLAIDYVWLSAELARCGVERSPADIRRADARVRPELDALVRGGRPADPRDETRLFLRSLVPHLVDAGAATREALVEALVPRFRSRGKRRLWSTVLPGVREGLAGLRDAGLQLVLVSNWDGTADEVTAAHGLRDFFDAVVDSHLVGFEKPDPRIFHHALEVSGAAAATTLYVGDFYHVDVGGARAAGLHALLLDPFDDWVGTDCERAPDLPALVERIAAARSTIPG